MLFRDVAEKVADRPGGYTRILKTGNRLGDNAEMCFIELVDYNENMLAATDSKAKPVRSRRGGKKKAVTPKVSPAPKVAAAKTKIVSTEDSAPEEKTEE